MIRMGRSVALFVLAGQVKTNLTVYGRWFVACHRDCPIVTADPNRPEAPGPFEAKRR